MIFSLSAILLSQSLVWAQNSSEQDIIPPPEEPAVEAPKQEEPAAEAPKEEEKKPLSAESPRVKVKRVSKKPVAKVTKVKVVKKPSKPKIPKPSKNYRPVIQLPRSFPLNATQRKWKNPPPKFEVETLAPSKTSRRIWLEEYLAEESLEPIAEVTEVEEGLLTAGPGQYIYIESEQSLALGDQLYAYREATLDFGLFTSPTWVRNLANVQITEILDNDGDRLYKGVVQGAVDRVSASDLLVRGRMPSTEFAAIGQRASVRAEVIADPGNRPRSLGLLGTYIFLDGGAEAGLQENQILSIMANPLTRNSESKYNLPTGAIALIKVVKVTSSFATALVVAQKDVVFPGDYTGSADQFEIDDRVVSSRQIIDISDDAGLTDEWAPFRPYMGIPIPSGDEEEARKIRLAADRVEEPKVETPKVEKPAGDSSGEEIPEPSSDDPAEFVSPGDGE